MQPGERLNGIQEVSGSIPLISTKNTRFHLKSSVFLYFSVCFVLGIFALDNKWTTDLLNFFFLTAGRKKLWCISDTGEEKRKLVISARFHLAFWRFCAILFLRHNLIILTMQQRLCFYFGKNAASFWRPSGSSN